MPDPHSYQRDYSFSDFQANNPSQPLPGPRVDNELENIELAISGLVTSVKDVRRSDGALKNQIVTLDSLHPAVKAGVGQGAVETLAAALAASEAAADSAEASASSAGAAAGSASAAATSATHAGDFFDDVQIIKTQVEVAKSAVDTARDFAAQWASAPEGQDVNDGVNPPNKSAYHWAKAAEGAVGYLPDGSITEQKLSAEVARKLNAPGRFLEEFGTISEAGDATDAMMAAAEWMREQWSAELGGGISTVPARLILPARRIVVEQSINLQGIDALGWCIEGMGCVIEARCTDRYLFDMLGSRWSDIRGLTVYGHPVQRPRGVILRGRPNTGVSAGEHILFHPKSSGYFSQAVIFDLQGESNTIFGGELSNMDASGNATIYISDGSNHLTVDWSTMTDYAQPTTAHNTGVSNTMHTFYGTIFRNMGAGPGLWMGRVSGVRMSNCYAVSYDDAGMVIFDDGSAVTNLDIDCLFETAGLTSMLRFERVSPGTTNVKRLRLNGTSCHAADEVIKTGANVSALNIEQLDLCLAQTITAPTNGVFSDPSIVTAKGSVYVPASSYLDVGAMAGFAGTFDADDFAHPEHHGSAYQVVYDNDGATPLLYDLVRKSNSPALADQIIHWRMLGQNDSAGLVEYAGLLTILVNATSGSESAFFDLMTTHAGVLGARMRIGAGISWPGVAGGDKGDGTVNFNNVFKAGNEVPSRLQGTATFDPASLADGAGTTTTVTVTGAALGDIALASFSAALQGIMVTAWVSAANTVSVRFQNETGGALDLASGTIKAWVLK